MDRARAQRLSVELKGKPIHGWIISDLIDHGKSALAFDAMRDLEVAVLKLFDPELVGRFGEDVQQERIRRESELIGKRHPHLVQIVDAGKDAGYFFVAMSKISGKPFVEGALRFAKRSNMADDRSGRFCGRVS
jgi:eukaryotic-like serine/threonine-protein kinase